MLFLIYNLLIKYSIQDVATVEIHRSVDMRIMTHQRIVALKCGVQLANTQNAQEADIAGLSLVAAIYTTLLSSRPLQR